MNNKRKIQTQPSDDQMKGMEMRGKAKKGGKQSETVNNTRHCELIHCRWRSLTMEKNM